VLHSNLSTQRKNCTGYENVGSVGPPLKGTAKDITHGACPFRAYQKVRKGRGDAGESACFLIKKSVVCGCLREKVMVEADDFSRKLFF